MDRLEEPRFYPTVGVAQLHRQHFKCTVHSRKTRQSTWPVPFSHTEQTTEVVFVDHDHLRGPDLGNVVVADVQVLGVANRSGEPNSDHLIVAVTAAQAVRLKSAISSGTIILRKRER